MVCTLDHRTGLSPRMRGNHPGMEGGLGAIGSIPTHAGEPSDWPDCRAPGRVYPRACGGTLTAFANHVTIEHWVYPRACGGTHRISAGVPVAAGGSIPAHAGEPQASMTSSTPWRVYPRACGEPRLSTSSRLGFRVYPRACGEPTATGVMWANSRVYPRACGGTSTVPSWRAPSWGLSPRMRGNRDYGLVGTFPSGSIPAHAGEPNVRQGLSRSQGVYPRACGGTRVRSIAGAGRSIPALAGNRIGFDSRERISRSIPAHAGEPVVVVSNPSVVGVYPRACGGTRATRPTCPGRKGLSPRIAGEPRVHPGGPAAYFNGSIPAHRGGTAWNPVKEAKNWVYPRARGGTFVRKSGAVDEHGSIPAHRGGTIWMFSRANTCLGLSPRSRGTFAGVRGRRPPGGSIPAHRGGTPIG